MSSTSDKASRADLESEIENLKAQLSESVREATRMGIAVQDRNRELERLADRAFHVARIPEDELTILDHHRQRVIDLLDFIEGLCCKHNIVPRTDENERSD